MCARARVHVYAFKIVCMDKILRFANTLFFISSPSISITCRTERTGQRRTPAELGHAEHICAVKVTVHLRQSVSLSDTCRKHSTGHIKHVHVVHILQSPTHVEH